MNELCILLTWWFIGLKGSKLCKKRILDVIFSRSDKHKLTILQMVSIECDNLSSSTTNENLTCLVLSIMKADLWANPVSEFIMPKCRDTERVVSDTTKISVGDINSLTNRNIPRGNDGINPKEGWSRKALWTISVSVDMAKGNVLSDANLSKLFLLLCNWVNEGDWWRADAKTYWIKARSLHAVGVLWSIENIRLNVSRSNN